MTPIRIAWITDPHLNWLPEFGAKEFGRSIAKEHKFELVLITGDIAEAPTLRRCLEGFVEGCQTETAFILGNHDFYKGSIAEVEKIAGGLEPNLKWLDNSDPVLLDQDTALVGQGGWYDGLLGDAEKSRVLLSDFKLIQDFKPHFHERTWLFEHGGRQALLDKLRMLSKQHAELARAKLLEAVKLRKHVILATHYPPFAGACWHEGNLSDSHWMPWFTSGAMGKMLGDVAADHPDNRFLVLCGHTHSPGVYQHLPNLLVMTGKAVYGAPDVAGILELPLRHWIYPNRCDRCDDQDFENTTTLITCKTCNRTWWRDNGIWTLDPES